MSDTVERCSVTELLVDQCAHCRPAPPPPIFVEPAEHVGQSGPWFEARYGGTCANCGDRFEAGESIHAIGAGEYECESCGDGPS